MTVRLVYQLEGDDRHHVFCGNMLGEELLSGVHKMIRLSIINGQGKIEKDIYKDRANNPHLDNIKYDLR